MKSTDSESSRCAESERAKDRHPRGLLCVFYPRKANGRGTRRAWGGWRYFQRRDFTRGRVFPPPCRKPLLTREISLPEPAPPWRGGEGTAKIFVKPDPLSAGKAGGARPRPRDGGDEARAQATATAEAKRSEGLRRRRELKRFPLASEREARTARPPPLTTSHHPAQVGR